MSTATTVLASLQTTSKPSFESFDLIVGNYRHHIRGEDLSQKVPAIQHDELVKLAGMFIFPEIKPTDESKFRQMVSLHDNFTHDPELWIEAVGRVKFSLEVATNPLFIFFDLIHRKTWCFNKNGEYLGDDFEIPENLPWLGIKKVPISDVDRYDLRPEVSQYFNRSFTHMNAETLLEKLENGEMCEWGDNIFIKMMRGVKNGYMVIPTGNDITRDEYNDLAIWTAHCFGDTDILVQEMADIRYEMRIFCVNGKAVTSAGQINDFTWLRNHETFDPQLQEFRGNCPVNSVATVRDNLLSFANEILPEVASVFENKNFSLDVAIINGKPGIVEMNSLCNSGLFACDIKRLVKAHLEA